MKYVCDLCGYIYEEKDIAFVDLPRDYACPECGGDKDSFISAAKGQSAFHTDNHSDSQR